MFYKVTFFGINLNTGAADPNPIACQFFNDKQDRVLPPHQRMKMWIENCIGLGSYSKIIPDHMQDAADAILEAVGKWKSPCFSIKASMYSDSKDYYLETDLTDWVNMQHFKYSRQPENKYSTPLMGVYFVIDMYLPSQHEKYCADPSESYDIHVDLCYGYNGESRGDMGVEVYCKLEGITFASMVSYISNAYYGHAGLDVDAIYSITHNGQPLPKKPSEFILPF